MLALICASVNHFFKVTASPFHSFFANNWLETSVHGIGSATFVTNSYAHGSLTAADDSMKIGIGYTSTSQINPSTVYLEGLEIIHQVPRKRFLPMVLCFQHFSPFRQTAWKMIITLWN